METPSTQKSSISGIAQLPKVCQYFDNFYLGCAMFSGAFLLILCALVLWSILARLLGLYSSGTSDYAGYFMAASTFMALAYTYRSHGHIRVELFFNRFKGKIVPIFCFISMALTSSYLAIFLTRLCYDSWEYQEKSEGADAILLWIPQSVIAFGAVIFALSVWQSLIEYCCKPQIKERS